MSDELLPAGFNANSEKLVHALSQALIADTQEAIATTTSHELTLQWKADDGVWTFFYENSAAPFEKIKVDIEAKAGKFASLSFIDDLDQKIKLDGSTWANVAVVTALSHPKNTLKINIKRAALTEPSPPNSTGEHKELDGCDLEEYICFLREKDFKKRRYGIFSFKSKAQQCEDAEPSVKAYTRNNPKHRLLLEGVNCDGADEFSDYIVYKLYPQRAKRLYIPLSRFEQVVLEKKRTELRQIAHALCARSIKVVDDKSTSSSRDANAGLSTGVVDAGGSAARSRSNQESQGMEDTFDKPTGLIQPSFDKDSSYWYKHEGSWGAMKNGRMSDEGSRMKTTNCTFKHATTSAVTAKFKAGMQGLNLSVGAAKEEHLSVHYELSVRFWTGGPEDNED
jgi:hypothetical protein